MIAKASSMITGRGKRSSLLLGEFNDSLPPSYVYEKGPNLTQRFGSGFLGLREIHRRLCIEFEIWHCQTRSQWITFK